MIWYWWVAVSYASVALLCFLRYWQIVHRSVAELREMGVEAPPYSNMFVLMALDSLRWPFYILRDGLKKFLEELK
jgi:hypothetical protein